MALDGTYTGLLASVADWLNRADLTANIPDFVKLTEAKIRRLVESQNITVDSTVSLTAETETLPATVKVLCTVELTDNSFKGSLGVRSMQQLADLKAFYSTTGVPQFCACVNNVLYLVPTPDISYAARITFEPVIDPLTTTATNWLLVNHPDIYLYGTLIEASPFLRDDPRVPMFEKRFDAAILELKILSDRVAYPNTPVQRPRRTLG